MADPEHLADLVKHAEKTTVQFSANGRTARGRRVRDRQLEVCDVHGAQLDDVVKELERWIAHETGGAVDRLMSAVGLNRDVLEQANMVFDFPSVRIEGKQETKTIHPANMEEMFTYPLGRDMRVDPLTWQEKTQDRLKRLSEVRGIRLDVR